MAFDLLDPMFAITDFWMARWLTPIWFLGVGIVAGLAILGLFVGLFYVLSKVTVLEQFRRDWSAHVVALVVTLVLGGAVAAYFSKGNAGLQFWEWTMNSIAITMMIGIVVWSVMYCSSPRFLGELRSLLFEGVGLYMLSTLVALAAIGLAASWLVDQPLSAIRGVPSLFTARDQNLEFQVDGSTEEFKKLDIVYDPAALAVIQIESNRRILIADAPTIGEVKFKAVTIEANTPSMWSLKDGGSSCPLPLTAGAEIYAQNQEIDAALLKIRIVSMPPVFESWTFVLVAGFVTIFGLLFMLMQAVSPKVAAIALSAAKSELSQPLPVILILLIGLTILLFVFLPFHTFGEDIKLLKDCGVTLILLGATFQAVWSASTSVNDEIEGRTALTLLSKPIHRRSFIIGKILGIFWIVMFMFLVLGSIELVAVAYKPIYDARESSLEQPPWQQCHMEMLQTIPGLALAFFQATVLGAISVALGTRFSLIANFSICFTIYLLGHLTPTIVESSTGGLPLVEFFAQLISAVIPNLSHFSMEAAIDADVRIPWSVISSVLVYTTIYGIAATLIGLLLFEDRDLA
jgi:hypothetical protein